MSTQRDVSLCIYLLWVNFGGVTEEEFPLPFKLELN